MISIYSSVDQNIVKLKTIEENVWLHIVSPSNAEAEYIASTYQIDIDHIKASLDSDESARIEIEEDYTLILVDIPTSERRSDRNEYTTIPLGIILCEHAILTVCDRETAIFTPFIENRVRDFSVRKPIRFLYQILLRIATEYQMNLRAIDRKRTEIESQISNITEDSELIELHELESNLVYFATSLRANGLILERLTRYRKIKQYPEDKELLEDVIIENKQAIEMTQIYRDIINGTRELMSAVINNRMNNIMKYLASITIVMSIPTIIGGLYGMNFISESIPLANHPFGFLIICGIIILICGITLLILRKRKMI